MYSRNDLPKTYSSLFGLLILSITIGLSTYFIKKNKPITTVKGVSETFVKSNIANWQISVIETSNSPESVLSKINKDQEIIKVFALKNGFESQDINLGSISINPNTDSKGDVTYQVYNTITLTSKNVDNVYKLNMNFLSNPLINKDLIISSSYVNYYYTENITPIKNELLIKSIDNAKLSGDLIAKKLDKKLGSVKSINQGLITINSNDGTIPNDTGSLMKKIRLVSTVEFNLD